MNRFVVLAIAIALAPAAWGQLYKYVDKDGKTVYTDQPPANTDSKAIKAPPPPRRRRPAARDKARRAEGATTARAPAPRKADAAPLTEPRGKSAARRRAPTTRSSSTAPSRCATPRRASASSSTKSRSSREGQGEGGHGRGVQEALNEHRRKQEGVPRLLHRGTLRSGLVLEGWEVKAIRAGRVQIKEAYVILQKEEPFVIGMHVSALPTASTHVHPDPTRSRKLLLNARRSGASSARSSSAATRSCRSTCTTRRAA
jgi:hypothetical protein